MKKRLFRVVDSEIVRNKTKIYSKAIVLATSETEALAKYRKEVKYLGGHLTVSEVSDVYTY